MDSTPIYRRTGASARHCLPRLPIGSSVITCTHIWSAPAAGCSRTRSRISPSEPQATGPATSRSLPSPERSSSLNLGVASCCGSSIAACTGSGGNGPTAGPPPARSSRPPPAPQRVKVLHQGSRGLSPYVVGSPGRMSTVGQISREPEHAQPEGC